MISWRSSNGNDGDNQGGDVLLLNADDNAVRKKLPGAPAFEKQIGWREWQADDALQHRDRSRKQRTTWAWGEREGGLESDDLVKEADLGRR